MFVYAGSQTPSPHFLQNMEINLFLNRYDHEQLCIDLGECLVKGSPIYFVRELPTIASKQANKRASKQANTQASNQASKKIH